MEASKIYHSSIITLANLIKDEKLRTKLLYSIELKNQTIQLIDNLLVLEIDHNCTFKDKKWSAVFGKALVNILKEKIKFEKFSNKNLDDILADITFFQTYCFNNLQVSRDQLTDESYEITDEFIKENSKISDELKTKYGDNIHPEPEVVDKKNEQPNNSKTNQQNESNFGAGAGMGSNAQSSGFNNNFNQNAFAQNANLPLHPLQDQRFYPYNSKPKYMKYFKWGLGLALVLTALLYLIISLLITFDYFVITPETLKNAGVSDEVYRKFIDYLTTNKADALKWSLYLSIYTQGAAGVFGIIILILMVLMIIWIVYTIIQPPRVYKEKFMIPGMTLVVPSMFVFMMIFSFINAFKFMFGADIQFDVLGSWFAQEIMGYTNETATNWINSNKEWLDALSQQMYNEMSFTALRVFLWLFFTTLISSGIIVIAIMILNPKIDRQKVAFANEEYQKMIALAMQGQKYEINSSIYEPQEEIDAFNEELKKRQDKKNGKSRSQE